MVNRGEILWLGIASGVIGGMTGGIMLAIGLVMINDGSHFGLVWMLVSVPGVVAVRVADGAAAGEAAGVARRSLVPG